jgi:hypothetical protein
VPNIIVELMQEMARVQALLPFLDSVRSHEADVALRSAKWYMAMNSLEGMTDSVADLREFKK